MKLYDMDGKRVTKRAAAVKARLVFTKADHEKWIHPPIQPGFYRPLELPTPPGWKPAAGAPEPGSAKPPPLPLSASHPADPELQAMTAKQLKSVLREKGLDDRGTKKSLIARLQEAAAEPEAVDTAKGGATGRIVDDSLEPKQMNAASSDWTFEMETLSDRPRVLRIKGFLSDAEADYMRNLANPHLRESNIASPGSNFDKQFMRNSYTTWAPPKFGSWMGGPVDRKLEAIVCTKKDGICTENDGLCT